MEGAKLSIHELQQLLASVTSMVRDNAARTEEIAATVNRIAASPFDPRISRGMTEARAEAATPPTTTPAVATTTASTKLVAASDGIAPTPASTGLDHDLGRNLAAVARPCAGCMSAAASGVPPTPTCRPAVVLELDIKAPTRCSIICSDDMDMPAVRPGVTSNIKYERQVLRPRPWPSFVGDQAAHGLTPYHGKSANTDEVYLWEEMASYNCAKDQAIFFCIEHSSYPTLVAVKFKQLCSVNVLSVGENCHAILDSEIVQLSDCELISMEEPLSCLQYVQLQLWCPPDQSKYEAEKLWSLLCELVSVVELWQYLSDGPLLALWTPPSQQGFSQTGVKGISCIGTFTTHTDCLMISMDFIHIALIGSEAIQSMQVNYKGLQSYACCIVQPLKGAEYLVHCDATYELDLERLALVRKLLKTDHCGFHWKTMLQTVVVRGLVPTTTAENNGSINSVCADEDGMATRKKRGVLVQRRNAPWDPGGSAWCRQFSPGYNQSLFKEGGVSQQLWPPPSSKSPPATSTTFEFDQVRTGNGCYLDAASLTFADAPFWHERLTMGHPSQALVLVSVQSLFLCGFATSCLWSGILESGNQLEFFGGLLITYAQGEYLCIGSVGVQPEWWCSSGNECLNPRGSILHGMENQLANAIVPGLVSISTIEGFNTTGDVTKSQLINSLTLTSKKGSQAPIYITYRAMQVRETRSVLISFASGSAPYFPEEGSPKSGKQFNESWGAQYVPAKQDGGINTEIYEETLLVLDGGAGNLKDKMELWNRSADSQLLRVDEFKGREHMATNCNQFGQNWYHSMRSAQTQFSYLPPVLHLIWGTAQISLQKAQYLIKWHCIRVGLSPWEILKICKQTRSSGVLPPPNDPMRGWTSVLPWKMSRNYSQVTYGNTSGMQVPRRKVGEPMSVVLSCVFAAAPRPESELGLLTLHATKFFAEVAIGRDRMVRSAQHDLYTSRRGYWCLVPFELSWISDRYVENILELSATSAYGSDLSHHWTTLGMSNKEEQYQGPMIILGCPLAHEGATLVMWVTSVLVAQTIDKQSTFSCLLAIGAELHAPWDPGGYNLQVCDYAGLRASRLLKRGECHVPTVTWAVGWTARQARKAEAHFAD